MTGPEYQMRSHKALW